MIIYTYIYTYKHMHTHMYVYLYCCGELTFFHGRGNGDRKLEPPFTDTQKICQFAM